MQLSNPSQPIRRSAYQKLTLVNGARFVARHLRTEAYPRPVYGWSIRNVTERTLLLFPGYADMNYLSQLEKLHGMQFNRPVVDDPAFPNTAHFVYLKNKKAFLFVASEDDNTARECCTKKTCVAGRQRKPIAEAAPSTYAPRQQNAAAPSVAIESSGGSPRSSARAASCSSSPRVCRTTDSKISFRERK